LFCFSRNKQDIEEICHGAARELELEIKMKVTEEEWTEQVLAFEHYKKRGPKYKNLTSDFCNFKAYYML
jgi:hypothetical protein